MEISGTGGIRQWLADDKVLLDPDKLRERQKSYPAQDEFYVLSPETGQITHTILTMPGYFATDSGPALEPFMPTYDPFLRYAIYAWEDPKSYEDGILLWDVLEQKEIWKRGSLGWRNTGTTTPGWKYDGSEAVIQGLSLTENAPLELISLTPDGQAKELTNLVKEGEYEYTLQSPKWSPNGRYIAFIFNADVTQPLDSMYLYILDIQTGKVTDYCISPVSNFYWSPDSSQIAIERFRQSLIILDIESGRAQSIDGVLEIFGWVGWSAP